MLTVLVTGGIGSGKSAVCAILSEKGIPVYDCDTRVKAFYERRPSLVKRLEEALGISLRGDDGKFQRARLASVIFSSADARNTVEDIVYSVLLADIERWRRRHRDAPVVAIESAILLSKPVLRSLPDAVVLVEAPEELRIRRVMQRSGLSRGEVLSRISAQEIPSGEAGAVIVNDGSEEKLARAVDAVFFDKNSYLCKLLQKESEQ